MLSPWSCLAASWEWGWTSSSPPPVQKDTGDRWGCSKNAPGPPQFLALDLSISPSHLQGCSGNTQACLGIPWESLGYPGLS